MSTIEPPDTHHLTAAIGWLELGNPTEAGEEIARVTPALLEHPDVLEVRWQVCAAGQSWDSALVVAELLVQVAPEKEIGWLHRAYALRRATGGGLEKAWQALRPVYEQFPKVSVIPYNLACYAAQMGRLEEAWDWFQKARSAAADVQALHRMALADRDMQPLWTKIQALE